MSTPLIRSRLYLGIKKDVVYKWIAEKQMLAHRMDRLGKFRKEEVDELVEPDSMTIAAKVMAGKPGRNGNFR